MRAAPSSLAFGRSLSARAGPLYVGKDPWHPGSVLLLDDLTIYDRALADEEIQVRLTGCGALSWR